MYEERRNGFSIRDIILQLLLVVLFIFIMIWLFPTKGYLNNTFATKDEVKDTITEQLQALYGRLYADNVESMRDAAKDYFTTERLPKNVGDKVTLTLAEMYEKKLVLPFTDSNNKACDTTKSYIELTKMDTEYQMKVQLTCSDYSDYIIVYMGCYNYCTTNICEKKTTPPTNNGGGNNEPNPTPTGNKKYEYEYRLTTQNSYSDWGNWSEWSTTKRTTDSLTQVDLPKTEKKLTGYEKVYGIVGYETETYTDYEYETTYEIVTKKVQVGTYELPVGYKILDTQPAATGNKIEYAEVIKTTTGAGWTNWTYQGTTTKPYSLFDDDTHKYEFVSQKQDFDCNSNPCKTVTYHTYKVYTRSYSSGTTTYSCPSGYNKSGTGANTICSKVTGSTGTSCEKYGTHYKLEGNQCIYKVIVTVTEPVYQLQSSSVPVQNSKKVTKTREVPRYGYTDKAIYEDITYYRYRTRTQTSVANTTYKWSTSQNDSSLTKQGYILTGNKREVK